MFSNFKNNAAQNSDIETEIGESTHLTGNIVSSGSVKIDGEFIGDIETKGDIIISQTGSVKGNISGANITIGGLLNGNVVSSGLLHITAAGKVMGDIETINLMVEDGGVINGKCIMTLDEIKRIIIP
ncbi:MAG: polymer-forming cytoskeletal protein [Clostridiaceae bacterium]|nr:polymer-forming cytoskeletal protein [Clostridiaceae bacterium]